MLYETISKDMVDAMKNKDKDSLNTLRLLKSAIDMYLVNNNDIIAAVIKAIGKPLKDLGTLDTSIFSLIVEKT